MTTDPADPEGRLVQMAAMFAATGHPIDPADIDRGRRILTGALTYEQARDEIVALYAQP